MKKGIITLVILVTTVLISKAQPNGGFESWSTQFSYDTPDQWQTMNILALTSPPNPVSAFKAIGIDKHSGNFALKLKTVFINNNPDHNLIPDSSGAIFTGKVNPSPFSYKYGFPYTSRAEKLEFWYKYNPVGNDTAKVLVILQKWTGTKVDTIASGLADILSSPIYNLFELPLVYNSTETPDTAAIVFLSSKNGDVARVGTTLFLDDVAFTGWVGIDEQKSVSDQVSVFPNPAKDNVNFLIQFKEADNIRILDSFGKLIGIYKIQNNKVNLNTSSFAASAYFYEILDKKSKVLTKGKFNVIK